MSRYLSTFSITNIYNRGIHRVAISVRMYVCDVAKHPLPGVVKTSGQRTYILAYDDTFFKKRGVRFLPPDIVKTRGFGTAYCG